MYIMRNIYIYIYTSVFDFIVEAGGILSFKTGGKYLEYQCADSDSDSELSFIFFYRVIYSGPLIYRTIDIKLYCTLDKMNLVHVKYVNNNINNRLCQFY